MANSSITQAIPQPVSELFSSYALYDVLNGSATPGADQSIKLQAKSVIDPPGFQNFDPIENGSLEWLDNEGYWKPVNSSENIQIGKIGELDLRFIPSAEASRLSGDIPLTIAIVGEAPQPPASNFAPNAVTIPLTLNDGAAFS
jgi:hypothetical protein